MVLAEGHSRAVSTDKILSSMEILCRSHIQKHVVMTSRFADILRGSDSASPLSDVEPTIIPQTAAVDYAPQTAPMDYAPLTRDNLQKLAREAAETKKLNPMAPSFSSPNSSAAISRNLTSTNAGSLGHHSIAYNTPTRNSGTASISQPLHSGPASTPQPLHSGPVSTPQPSNSSVHMTPVQSSSNAALSAPNSSALPKSSPTMDTRASASISSTGNTIVTRASATAIPAPFGSGTITANFSSDAKLNDESAFSLFWAIGVSPTRTEKPSASRLDSFSQNYLQMSQVGNRIFFC